MSLSTNTSNTQIQAIYALELNPAYDALLAEKNPEKIPAAKDKVQAIIEKIEKIDPNHAFFIFSPSSDLNAPRGIANEDANCWANALIHLIMNSSTLKKRICSSNDTKLEPIAKILSDYKAGEKIDSQAFRVAIAKLVEKDDGYKLSTSSSSQIDVMKAYQLLANACEMSYLFSRIKEFRGNESTFSIPMSFDSTTEILLMMQGKTAFDEMIKGFFDNPLDEGKQGYEVRKLKQAPQDLVIQAKRFSFDLYGNEIKIDAPIHNVPLKYQLPNEYTEGKEANSYELTSCIIHLGTSMEKGGHYVTLEKRGDTFYFTNDNSVFKWEKDQWILVEGYPQRHPQNYEATLRQTPQKMIEQGYLFQYSKVSSSPIKERAVVQSILNCQQIMMIVFMVFSLLMDVMMARRID